MSGEFLFFYHALGILLFTALALAYALTAHPPRPSAHRRPARYRWRRSRTP